MFENNEAIKGTAHRELFSSVVYLMKMIKKKGFMFDLDNSKIITKFESSKKLLTLMIKLLRDGSNYPTFDFNINLEFVKLIKNSSNEVELTELVLAKELVHYVYKADVDAIYELICHVGSERLRNELAPVLNWIDLE